MDLIRSIHRKQYRVETKRAANKPSLSTKTGFAGTNAETGYRVARKAKPYPISIR